MSALIFQLLLHLCVWTKVFQANGIPNLHYPIRYNNNPWRFSKRQDFLTKTRLFMLKPAFGSAQMYTNLKKPTIPLNFNRYAIQSQPIMAPIQQSYMFAVPTKMNYMPYQPMKDIDEKRKPGNLHHVTIINALMPKPYLSTSPTHNRPTSSFPNYRANNKQQYHLYINNLKQVNAQQIQLQQQQQLQQHQQQLLPFVYPSSPPALQMNTPTNEYLSINNYNAKTNDMDLEPNKINTPISQCERKRNEDANNSASDIFYYYCNNRITNYKNPTQQQIISIFPTTTSTTSTTSTSTTTTTTTTAAPSITTTKGSRIDLNSFTTERIFLPTPNPPLVNNFIPLSSTKILKNSITDSDLKLQSQNNKQQRHTAPRSENIRAQQHYTAAPTYDHMKLHSFFTIEDAITRAPDMQVFNDPYQAYRHARRQQINHQRQTIATTNIPDATTTTAKSKFKSFFDDLDDEEYSQRYRHGRRQPIKYQRQTATTTTTTTKIPETTTTVTKPRFKSFFDVLDDEDYIIPEDHHYNYGFFGKPQKSINYKSEFANEATTAKHNQVTDQRHKATENNEFTAVATTLMGIPKIKEHHFGLFKTTIPTTHALPTIITTYKPTAYFKDLFLTTSKPRLSTLPYNSKPTAYTTTFNTILGNHDTVIEKENNTVFLNEVSTTTPIPLTAVAKKKSTVSTFKPTSNLRSSAAFKYPKQRRLHKPYKNLTSTTTKATPTLKKVPKYQRLYKSKKLKQFKHLYTTTSTTTTSTTTTTIPTTVESFTTRKTSVRSLPTTSTAEDPTTKKPALLRISTTAEVPKPKPLRQQPSSTTEATKRNKIKARTATTPTTIINNSTTRAQSKRRGSKRANIAKSERETAQVTTKANNKHRRRVTSSSTTAKPFTSRTSSATISTSTLYSTPTPTSLRTSSTTSTMKSVMRISNSKSRAKHHNDVRSQRKGSNEVKDERQKFDGRASLNSIASTMPNIPPLPIEIYFKKSHNSKI